MTVTINRQITKQKLCERCREEMTAFLVRTVTASGVSQIWWKCVHGHAINNPRQSIAHKKIKAAGIAIEDIPVEASYQFETCEVCGAIGVESHHWAPIHLFGMDAENWPKGYLCRSCHEKWHRIVTPNMSKRNSDGYRKTFDQQVRTQPQNTAR